MTNGGATVSSFACCLDWQEEVDESTLDTFLKNKSYESKTFTGSNPDTIVNENEEVFNFCHCFVNLYISRG